jgi:hypothetical protein
VLGEVQDQQDAEEVLRPAEEVWDEPFAATGWREEERPEEAGL